MQAEQSLHLRTHVQSSFTKVTVYTSCSLELEEMAHSLPGIISAVMHFISVLAECRFRSSDNFFVYLPLHMLCHSAVESQMSEE